MIDNIWILQSAALTPHFCRDIMRNATHGNVQPPSSNTRFKSNRVVTIYHACFWKLLIKSLLSHECLQGLSYCCTFDCRWPFGSWLYDLLRYFLCSFLVYLNIHIYIYIYSVSPVQLWKHVEFTSILPRQGAIIHLPTTMSWPTWRCSWVHMHGSWPRLRRQDVSSGGEVHMHWEMWMLEVILFKGCQGAIFKALKNDTRTVLHPQFPV